MNFTSEQVGLAVFVAVSLGGNVILLYELITARRRNEFLRRACERLEWDSKLLDYADSVGWEKLLTPVIKRHFAEFQRTWRPSKW